MILRVTDDRYLSAVGPNPLPLGDRVGRIIRSFRVNVGTNDVDQFVHGGFIEDRDRVNETEAGNDLGPLRFRNVRAAVSLKISNLPIGVDTDNQKSIKPFRAAQVTYVAGMDQVKAPVSQNYCGAGRSLGRNT